MFGTRLIHGSTHKRPQSEGTGNLVSGSKIESLSMTRVREHGAINQGQLFKWI